MISDFDLVIFDCDGVLVDSEPIATRVNLEMLGELGWHLTPEEFTARFVGRSMTSNLAQLEEHFGRPAPTEWVERLSAAVSAAHDAELVAVEGIIEALDVIDEWDVRTCVASSGSPSRIRHSLKLLDMYDRFDGRLFSAAEVPHGKPAPDLFLHAARSMGAQPTRCVVVEDSQYGVQAARAAGMRALGYAGGVTPAEWLEGPGTVVFTDMRKLPDLIATL